MSELFVPAAGVRPLPIIRRHILISDGMLLLHSEGLLHRQLPVAEAQVAASHYLGELGGDPCGVHFLASQPDVSGCSWRGLRGLLGQVSELEFSLAGRAVQVINWDLDHRFCGRCGAPTDYYGNERARCCTGCHLTVYPRISPCVIMLVTRGEECLLARHTHHKHGLFTALAGFIEAGESAEEALAREVREEVGLQVGATRYVGSQPWPFPGQLMLGYLADWAGGDVSPDVEEISEAAWFRFDQLPEIPPPETLSGQLIRNFAAQCASRKP
ncbi:NADH pyrophosphatase [Microbulbifer aggregans]|uniref:NAD(+) diphosphatase n=1 Tax=Microbulbifer aggregans TaxID=1769779 RepID=A0A1C9W962_9GAMM|nr:NAD(+) diphosphatase [Microbulbifer aggregans]AOS97681.1 NADH pyrophosphatase [Microbulbifer aggregans]